MTRERLATTTAAVGAGLLLVSGGWHLSAYGFIVAQAAADARPLLAALWIACGITLWLAALLVVAVTPLQIIRRRALLFIAALTPLSIAVLQVAYLGFMTPTALLLMDALVLAIAGQLGHTRQPTPVPAA